VLLLSGIFRYISVYFRVHMVVLILVSDAIVFLY
jgi:hypothetical protein